MNRTERRKADSSKPPDRRRVIVYATIGILAVLVVAAIALSSRTPKSASDAPMYAELKTGQDAPKFSVSATGGPVSVPVSDGKPVLLEVFATWCPHCQHETAVLNKLFAKYGGQVHFVAVSGSEQGMDGSSEASQADVMNFVSRFGVRYPVAYDGSLDVAKKYLQGGYPTIVVIGKDNKILAVRDGEITEKQLSDDLNKSLKA
jgi:thiol-disulfide isomerase/thioredoxin